ncbi:MAG TPA: cytochrome c oxidase subunit 4 [Candidatus Limnocylindrales bacterium]|nr:cytochrome c oxidase subunit 4 [Candidatus Limnocylindrales bacterium]
MSRDVTERLDEDDHVNDSPDLTPGPRVDPQHGGPDEAETGFTAEAKLFARMSAFGLVIGVVYWLLTYEAAGSVMLTTFGLASGIAALAIVVGSRGQRRPGRPAAEGPVGASREGLEEPVPRPGWAPLGIAIGVGGVALAGPFGPWLAIAGLFFAIRSAKSWLDASMQETDEARGLRRADQEDLGAS